MDAVITLKNKVKYLVVIFEVNCILLAVGNKIESCYEISLQKILYLHLIPCIFVLHFKIELNFM